MSRIPPATWWRALLCLTVTLASPLMSRPGEAHTEAAFLANVDHPFLVAGPGPDAAQLRFSLHNNTGDALMIVAIETSLAKRVTIMARVGGGMALPLPAITVPPHESIDFSGKLWVELNNLSAPLRQGQEVSFRLIFSDGRWSDIVALVGDADDH